MTKLDPAEANRRRLKLNSTNFDFKFLDPVDLRKILRSGLALCELVELPGKEKIEVHADTLYVTKDETGLFSYKYAFKGRTQQSVQLNIVNKYSQSDLDRLASQYKIKV